MNKIRLLFFALLLFALNLDAQVDTVSPVLVCKNILVIHLNNFCFGYLKAQELLDTVYDDSQYYELALRKECTGDGFPPTDSLLFLANEFIPKVELWARDSTGNISTCAMTLYFPEDGFCDFGSSLRFTTLKGDGIDGVSTHIIGENCHQDSIDYQISDPIGVSSGWNSWSPGELTGGGFAPYAGYAYDITPARNDDPLNGVTTYDLVLISKHIIGTEILGSPYKVIAADANQDGKVTTFDILLLRKLILGLITELPNGKSWNFIPMEYIFPNPQNPFDPPFPNKITVPRSYEFPYGSHEFLGVKIGDVNYSANPNY